MHVAIHRKVQINETGIACYFPRDHSPSIDIGGCKVYCYVVLGSFIRYRKHKTNDIAVEKLRMVFDTLEQLK